MLNYPLPRIHQALDALQGKRYFSVFDLLKAYWQLEVEPAAGKYLVFITPDGLYEWTPMPFGVAGSPAVQQRMMDRLLAGLKWVCAITYLVDIVIFSDTFEQYLQHLEALFVRCQAANSQLQPTKSVLCQKEIKYLGFIVSAEGVHPDLKKTEPIRNFPRPIDRKGVRKFLGIGSYYRCFIRNFARMAAPLQQLIPDNASFQWGAEQEEALESIKEALINATAMTHPQPGLPFIIDCDAAVQGLGAVLQQRDSEGRERPICFASRVLRSNERKWPITELEAFAVVWALETFRVYIEGSPTLVRTDHSPLLWLRNHAGKSTRIARWVLRLQEFAFDLQHRAGRCNAVADALSRYPTGDPDPEVHDTMFAASLCALVRQSERCQACWRQTRTFLTRGGGDVPGLSGDAVRERAVELVNLEVDPGPGVSRQTLPPGNRTIQEAQALCAECIVLRQYLDNMPEARLPQWVQSAGLRPVLRDGVLCLAKLETSPDVKPARVVVPKHLRVPLIQRAHAGTFAGHFGRKKTLAKLRERYLWESLSSDVSKVFRMCVQCWQYARGGPKKIPLRSLPRGWPGEVVAMDLFGPLPRTNRGSTIILVLIDHFTSGI